MKIKIDHTATHSANSKPFLRGEKQIWYQEYGRCTLVQKEATVMKLFKQTGCFFATLISFPVEHGNFSCNITTVPTCQLNGILRSISGPRKSCLQVACYRTRNTKNFLIRNFPFSKTFYTRFPWCKNHSQVRNCCKKNFFFALHIKVIRHFICEVN